VLNYGELYSDNFFIKCGSPFLTSGIHLFLLKVDVEESIVNAPLVSLQSKNTNKAKSEVRFKELVCDP
jgi:hypothetical protein